MIPAASKLISGEPLVFNMTVDGNIETFKWRKKSTIGVRHAWGNSSLNKVFMGAKRLHLTAAIK